MPKRKASSDAPSAKRGRIEPVTVLSPDTITKEQFDQVLGRYVDAAKSLRELDAQRYERIPSDIRSRSPRYLTHDELVTLVEWKLKHGTFRPNLLAMAKQHDPSAIQTISTSAFAQDAVDGLKTLSTLRGIGPATASLLLSCADPSVPFFSDELYRWMMQGGWDKKIGYTPKEYRELLEKVKIFRERIEVPATDVEKVAYVIGRENRTAT